MIRAVVFDLYGTLLDITALAPRVAADGVPDAAAFVERWRRVQIEYAWCSALAGVWHDFDDLTARALGHVLALAGVDADDARRARLAALWRELPPYDDVAGALDRLAAAGVARYVLTNGVRASALATLERAGLAGRFDDVLSVEAVRTYKPDPRVYALVGHAVGGGTGDALFVSSNAWDAAGAATYGLRVAWVNRAGGPPSALGPAPFAVLRSLAELDAALATVGS